jgi:hypothetical protein
MPVRNLHFGVELAIYSSAAPGVGEGTMVRGMTMTITRREPVL